MDTYSGSHPFRPDCLLTAYKAGMYEQDDEGAVDRVAFLIRKYIDKGLCPRCTQPLKPKGPAGSRVTECRCIPICAECAQAEVLQGAVLAATGDEMDNVLLGMVGPVTRWPIDPDRQAFALLEWHTLHSRPGSTVDLIVDPDFDPEIDAPDGWIAVAPRPNPGGWLEYGYDDTEDEEQKKG